MAETLDAALTADTTDLTIDSASWWKRVDARNDSASTNEDTPVKIDVLANDVGALGIVKVNGKPVTADTPVTLGSGATVDLDGKTLTYDPGKAFQDLDSGVSKSDTFTYTVVGKYKSTDTATVSVSIAGVNDPGEPGSNHAPVANNDYASLPDYYPYPGPIPLPYEEADAASATDASVSDGPIMTTLALGEEGDPYPYPSSVDINVLANDTDADNDPLKVATIAGKKVDTDDLTTNIPASVTLESGAEVTLSNDGTLTYSKGIIIYADTDPQPLTAEAVTFADGELVPIDPILPPEPWPVLADTFTYTAADDEGAESNAATVTVYRAFYDYVQGAEPVADAPAPATSDPSTDIAATEPLVDASATLDQPNELLA